MDEYDAPSESEAEYEADAADALREASGRRLRAGRELSESIEAMNRAVQEARAAGVSAVAIADAIGTTRQRVYEILRG